MGHNRKHKSAAAEKPARIEAPPHDWLTPVSVDAPCGPDLEYDPEFVVLEAQVAARGDAQYGDFVGSPEPVNWSDVERDCRRLMMRSKDMRLAVLFTRCRTRMTGATGLAEGLQLLTAWLAAFPETIHPQLVVDDERDVALEIRMNALQALTDQSGLIADMREIALTRSSAVRLQVRDVERAFMHPRPNDALAPESVARQLEDLRVQKPMALTGFDQALNSVASIEAWSSENQGDFAPDLAVLTRLLQRVTGASTQKASAPVEEAIETTNGGGDSDGLDDAGPEALFEATAPENPTDASADVEGVPVQNSLAVPPRANNVAQDRAATLSQIREARHWFEQHEPSSPIPIFLRQAELCAGKRYAQLVSAIPPELLAQWESE